MGRAVNRLTDKAVKALTAPGKYADGDGLYLVVDDDGLKRWIVYFPWRGKRREMGLGGYQSVRLAEAREMARTARKLAAEGTDPIETRKARKAATGVPTLGEVAKELIAELKKGWKGTKSETSWTRSFDLHAKTLVNRPVDTIDTPAIVAVLKPIWTTKAASAGKLRDRLERALDAARVAGHITGPWENPARWKGHLEHLLVKRPKLTRGHHKSMPFAQIPAFMPRLAGRVGMSARALEWTILTVARETMTLGAQVKELDREAMVWTVPGERMKGPGASPFRVPVTPQALAVIDRAWPPDQKRRPDDYLFPSRTTGGPMSNTAMDNMLHDLGEPFTPHGFRSSFRDWGGDRTNFPRDLLEECLAHVVGDETERAYRRSDALEKRRKVLEAWARFCLTPASGANVLPMRRA